MQRKYIPLISILTLAEVNLYLGIGINSIG